MDRDVRTRFRQLYQGRHDPDDALHWIDHPASSGPSSAPPPQQVHLDAAAQLEAAGQPEAAAALVEAAVEVLAVDRRLALDALALAREAREG